MTGVTDSRHEAGHGRNGNLIDELASFASHHKATRWRGSFAEFLRDIFPTAPHQFVRSSHQYLYDMLGWYRTLRARCRGGHHRRQSEGPLHHRTLWHRRRPRPRRRVLQGGERRLRRRPSPAAAARPALRRQVLRRDPHEARAGGIQPHRRRCPVCAAGLPAARIAAQPGPGQHARQVPRDLRCGNHRRVVALQPCPPGRRVPRRLHAVPGGADFPVRGARG